MIKKKNLIKRFSYVQKKTQKLKKTLNLYIYFSNLWKIDTPYKSSLMYDAYQNKILNVKNNLCSIRYINNLKSLKSLNRLYYIKYSRSFFFQKKLTFLNNSLIKSFISLYNNFFILLHLDFFFILNTLKQTTSKPGFNLILNFVKNKPLVILQNNKKKNYLFLSTGLFIKFFEKKKSFKKNKTIKILMAKYIRKLLIILKIKKINFFIKKTPNLLLEILTFVYTPIIHKFNNPIDKSIIDETDRSDTPFIINYFIFLNNIDFSLNKGKKKGRIKRKILRKLIFENKVID